MNNAQVLVWVNDPTRTTDELRDACQGLGLATGGNATQRRARLRTFLNAQRPNRRAAWYPGIPPAATPPAAGTPATPAAPPVTTNRFAGRGLVTSIGAVAAGVVIGLLGLAAWLWLWDNIDDDNNGATPASSQTSQQDDKSGSKSGSDNSGQQSGSTQQGSNNQSGSQQGQPPGQQNASGCSNSPNIPCVMAQGQKNGFTPFEIDNQVIGGPAEQWWPLQKADGSFVPNSFKMVGMRQSDRGLPGYEMHVPDHMILDIWLDNGGLLNRKTAARVYGPADIKADWKVAEATLYTRPFDFVDGLKGKWARLSDTYQCGDFVQVGTLPPVINAPHDCHQAGSGSGNPSTGASTASSLPSTINGIPTDRFSVIEDGKAIKLAGGNCISFDLPAGLKADIWDGTATTHPVGPTNVPKACEGTIRPMG